MGAPAKRLVEGGPRERAAIFRDAIEQHRTVSVGYRPGGMLEVCDLTGRSLTLIEHGFYWTTADGERVFHPGHEPFVVIGGAS
jgi:hypothetical protein